MVANPHLNTLIAFRRRRHFAAQDGAPGRGKDWRGRSGGDLEIPAPLGTTARDAETGSLLADLVEPNQRALVARGGRGGRGNAAFASPTNQAPRLAEKGEPGEEREVYLELRLIADVGVIGCPNAGKSTLLAKVSAARPKIADYPFTTLTPNLGLVECDDTTFVMADIPGLIEGAHRGLGLGHQFLRHIARTRLLVHLLDGTSADPVRDFQDINQELALYDLELAEKPQIVALNKIDLPLATEKWPQVKEEMERLGHRLHSISGLTGEGIQKLLREVVHLLAEVPGEKQVVEEVVVFGPPRVDEAFDVLREGKGFRVRGTAVERLAAMTNWDQPEAVQRAERILDRLGVTEALRKEGVKEGDTVFIGEAELEWR